MMARYQIKYIQSRFLTLMCSLILMACNSDNTTINSKTEKFEPALSSEVADGKYPYKRLSTYGFFDGNLKDLNPIADVILYQPASSLFTDYALKSRYVHFKEGTKATITKDELELPIGATLIKNFFYPVDFRQPDGDRKIIETRLMVHQISGWEAYPYIWNDSQTEAILRIVGGETEVKFIDNQGQDQIINYLIPNKNQCKSCHNSSEKLVPIGVKISQLNHEIRKESNSQNQLANWTSLGVLEGFESPDAHPSWPNYEDKSLAIDDRARAYLNINCAHCHQPEGPASTSGLFLTFDQKDPMNLGINKTPVAAGIGAGQFKFDIVPGNADESILHHRINSTQMGVAMPEIGRTSIHHEGVELIRDWINSLN